MSISNGVRLARSVGDLRDPRGRGHGFLSGILFLVTGMLVVAVCSLPAARAAVPIPMTTEGTAYDASGSPLPQGTPVRTFIDGVDYSNDSAVSTASGSYSVLTQGNLVINATTPEPSPTKHGANAGETVVYTASDFTSSADVFQETTPWHSDTVVGLDLHLGSAGTTPQAVKIQGIVSQPARGGPPYIFLCNPTAAPVSLSDYYLQRDAPGTYYGANLSLAGALAVGTTVRENLTAAFGLVPSGDALKLVYRNPGGGGASAGGMDIVVDRVEFNASVGGTLDWQPGSTVMGSAPAPGPGRILERSPSCADTNSPSDFHLAIEPGLPPSAPPIVTILAPVSGQNLQGGQVFTLSWSIADAVFVTSYIDVWVNVTVNGVTTTLVAGTEGATSAGWNVPDLEAPGSVVRVEVTDPFGERGNATTVFNVTPATPFSAVIAILVVVVVAVFILWAYRRAQKEAERQHAPPATPPVPPTTGPPPTAAPTVTTAVAAGPPGTKVCPQCHTPVNDADETCFYCGHRFVAPP